MTTKLIQKKFLKATREFEIADDSVYARIKTPFKEEKITIGLSMIDSEPVINDSELEFYGRGKSKVLFSLYLNKPNTEEFNAFVEALKQSIQEGRSIVIEELTVSITSKLPGNVYEEPPEFGEPDKELLRINSQKVKVRHVEEAIQMLETYLLVEETKPLLSALESLKSEPNKEANLLQLLDVFKELGPMQGAVLTYAPYIGTLLVDDPFEGL